MPLKEFTLLNTGTGRLAIQSFTFNNPTGIGHTANLLNLGGSSTETANASGLSYSLAVGESQTFTVDYSDGGAGGGTYNGSIVIGGSNGSSNTIAATIVLAGASPPAPSPPPPPPAPSYTVTPASSSVNEGSSLTFNVGGSYIGDGTYYWTVTNSGDFGTASGSFTITGNSGSFNVTPTADSSTEGSETFTASIRSVSVSGDILATSSTVTINDTSVSPPSPPPPSPPPSPPPPSGPTLGFDNGDAFSYLNDQGKSPTLYIKWYIGGDGSIDGSGDFSGESSAAGTVKISGPTKYVGTLTSGIGSNYEVKVSIGTIGTFTTFSLGTDNYGGGGTTPYHDVSTGIYVSYSTTAPDAERSVTGTLYIRNKSTLVEISRGFTLTLRTGT